jgi:hypothetical protein
MLHQDSLGSVQRIERGALNWMTAGRGIRIRARSADLRATYGIRPAIVGAAQAFEASEPAFHHGGRRLPEWSRPRISPVLTARSAWVSGQHTRNALPRRRGHRGAPSSCPDPGLVTFERAVWHRPRNRRRRWRCSSADDGSPDAGPGIDIAAPPQVKAPDTSSSAASRSMGRFIWWNFVSSSRERIEQAKLAWTAQQMGKIPGEHEWIALP